ncbi:MAG: hypothetical protein GY861_04350, partial [bacterium]|nr:hypothetical protein [bacterium]
MYIEFSYDGCMCHTRQDEFDYCIWVYFYITDYNDDGGIMANIYNVSVIENQIERIAADNDGEIPDELLKELVEAQTKSLDSVENMVKYVRHLELGIVACKAEEQR